jgi:hypothetical protein
MTRLFLLPLLLLPALLAQAHPLDWLPRSYDQSDRAWSYWSILWATDQTVTVVRNEPVSFIARPALFGSAINHPLLGYVIPLDAFTAPCANTSKPIEAGDGSGHEHGPHGEDGPNDGCPRLCVIGSHVPDPAEPWIALVQRGNCAFAHKAREAQRLGAKAVLVGGDAAHSDTLINMIDSGAPFAPNLPILVGCLAHSLHACL